MTPDRRRNFVVGLFVMVAVGVLLAITLVIRGGVDVRRKTLYAAFPEVSGLEVGSPVMISGVRAGRVLAIEGREEKPNILVTIQVGRGLPVYADARALIAQQGFIGDKRIDVDPGTEATGLVEDGALITGVPIVGLEQTIERVNAISADLQLTVSAVREIVANEANRAAVESSVADLSRSMQVVARMLEANEENLNAIIADTRVAMAGLAALQERAGALLDNANTTLDTVGDESLSLIEELRGATSELRERGTSLLGALEAREQTLGDSAEGLADTLSTEVKGLSDSLVRTSNALESILAKIDRGDGTAGLLVNDPSLYRGLAESVQALRNALIGPNRRLFDTRIDYGPAPAAAQQAP